MDTQQNNTPECESAAQAQMPAQPHDMNIGTAKNFYSNFSAQLLQDVSAVVELIRASNINEPLSNSNYLHALAYTDLMMRHAQHHFRMLTGCAGGGFIGCLRDSFEAMLARLKENKGTVRIILVNSDSKGPLEDLKAKYPETLEFTEATVGADAKVCHFIVCDDDIVRDEEWHEKIEDSSSAEEIKAQVYFRNPSKGQAQAGLFDAIWKRLVPTASPMT